MCPMKKSQLQWVFLDLEMLVKLLKEIIFWYSFVFFPMDVANRIASKENYIWKVTAINKAYSFFPNSLMIFVLIHLKNLVLFFEAFSNVS